MALVMDTSDICKLVDWVMADRYLSRSHVGTELMLVFYFLPKFVLDYADNPLTPGFITAMNVLAMRLIFRPIYSPTGLLPAIIGWLLHTYAFPKTFGFLAKVR